MLGHILAAYGVDLPDLQMSTLERRIADPDLPAELKELLSVRLAASTTSTSKYKTLAKAVSKDGRLRGTLQFNGASRTGRWAGRLFQPQNLPRPALKQDKIDIGIEALKADCEDLLFDNVMELTSSAIRGCIIAPPGKKLVVADLSNIEGRVLAWLAGEEWKLQAFRDFDTVQTVEGEWLTGPQLVALHLSHQYPELALDEKGDPIRMGHDLYKLAYAKSFGIKPEAVTKDNRQSARCRNLPSAMKAGSVPSSRSPPHTTSTSRPWANRPSVPSRSASSTRPTARWHGRSSTTARPSDCPTAPGWCASHSSARGATATPPLSRSGKSWRKPPC
jgi:DNA polymerase